MSKQLTLSAAFSVFAMAAFVLSVTGREAATYGSIAHGEGIAGLSMTMPEAKLPLLGN